MMLRPRPPRLPPPNLTAVWAGLRVRPESNTLWQALYDYKFAQLKGAAARKNVPSQDQTDLAQQAMVELAAYLQKAPKGSTNIHKLLATIHSSNITDYWRRRNLRWHELRAAVEGELVETIARVPDPQSINAREWAELNEYLTRVDSVIQRLGREASRQFPAFKLCVLDGLPPHDTAVRLGIKRELVDLHVNRFRERLRAAVRQELAVPGEQSLSTLVTRNYGACGHFLTRAAKSEAPNGSESCQMEI